MEVQEIIRLIPINKVPHTPNYVRGVISLRNRVLPIIELASLFGMKTEKPYGANIDTKSKTQASDDDTDLRRIIVVDINGVITGLQVDSVSEVLRLAKSSIEPAPPVVTGDKRAKLKGVGKLNSGERLIMLLDLSSTLSVRDIDDIAERTGASRTEQDAKKAREKLADETQFVCFNIGDEEYAVKIMQVQEIIRFQKITAVPRAPEFVEGILNLRGNVLPIIDMRKRLYLPEKERDEQNRILVVDINGRVTGLIVDSVNEVFSIINSEIEPPPDIIAGIDRRFIQGVGKVDSGKRIIIILEPSALLSLEEIGQLQNINGSSKQEQKPKTKAVETPADEQEIEPISEQDIETDENEQPNSVEMATTAPKPSKKSKPAAKKKGRK
jgi:purine-binding chemotaxis protein CheW